ncbi:MAG: uncharacterized protein K0R38_5949 [Polyangiaceae bacterium]|nr:uncharacterized protein [Polyangiaceae bacterium]
MLRDLLVRASAGLLAAAIAVSCTRGGEAPREEVGSVQQAATLAGQGGAELGAAGAPSDAGGAPAGAQGGADGEPETCDPATCEGQNRCTRCVGNQCVRYTAADNHTCRAADASGCDVADVCDGTSDSCTDAVAPSTTKCGTAVGLCDVDDFCDGTTKVCADAKRANGFVCRDAVATGCDVADTCDGASNACPDAVRSSATKCRDAAAGGCDVDDYCDGATSVCTDAKRPVNFVCRPTVPGGCDVQDVCDGSTNVCPNVVATNATACRDAAGDCDAPDFCDGTTTACADVKQAPGFVCRTATGECDVADTCNGTSNSCVDAVAGSATQCRTATGECDVADFCSGVSKACLDIKRPSGALCRGAVPGGCDVQEVCDGASSVCPNDVVEAVGKVCRVAEGQCDLPESCNGSPECPPQALQPDGTSCTDADDKCLLDTTCTAGECGGGTAKTCPQNDQCKTNACVPTTGSCALSNKLDNTVCNDSINCTTSDRCRSGSCVGTPDNTLCRKPEHGCGTYTCDPSTNPALFPDYCKMTPLAKGEQCRKEGGICGIAEVCDGASEDCPPDLHRPPSFACQAPTCVGSVAKPQIFCSGNGTACPAQSDVSCEQYACDATTLTCGLACTGDEGCQPDHYCVGGTCEKRINPGGKCSDDTQCEKSNPHCVDGVCCNTICKEQCEACDIEGDEGTCLPVTGEPHGTREACGGDGSSCNGACNGQLRGACEYPARSVECLEASCDPQTRTAWEKLRERRAVRQGRFLPSRRLRRAAGAGRPLRARRAVRERLLHRRRLL